jgi:hypothetical protein
MLTILMICRLNGSSPAAHEAVGGRKSEDAKKEGRLELEPPFAQQSLSPSGDN